LLRGVRAASGLYGRLRANLGLRLRLSPGRWPKLSSFARSCHPALPSRHILYKSTLTTIRGCIEEEATLPAITALEFDNLGRDSTRASTVFDAPKSGRLILPVNIYQLTPFSLDG
jgi:hypothetical protein